MKHIDAVVPNWFARVVFWVFGCFVIDRDAENQIRALIDTMDEHNLNLAKALIHEQEVTYGMSPFTVKYRTRIDRIRLLGE